MKLSIIKGFMYLISSSVYMQTEHYSPASNLYETIEELLGSKIIYILLSW